jgi:hypothetical protein
MIITKKQKKINMENRYNEWLSSIELYASEIGITPKQMIDILDNQKKIRELLNSIESDDFIFRFKLGNFPNDFFS